MRLLQIPRYLAWGIIRLYQKTLSPDHGLMHVFFPNGACKFYPSCSVYAQQVMMTYGVLKGGVLTLIRLSRCHPWSRGGHDPIIPPIKKIV